MSNEFPTAHGSGVPEYLDSGGGTPVPGGDAVPPRRGLRPLLIGGSVVGGLALAGAGTWAALSLSGGGPQPAAALPAGTLGLVSIDLDPSASQKIEAMKMLNKFPAFKEEVGLDPTDDLRAAIFDEFQNSADCPDLSFADDIEPWLGSRAAVAAVPGADQAPTPVVVVQVTDEKEADAGLTALRECGSDADSLGWVLSDGWAVLAEQESVAQDVVDAAKAGSLADDPTYRTWLDEVGEPGIVTMYAAPDAGQALADAMGDQDALVFGADAATTTLADFGGMAATVRFNDGALEVEAAGKMAEVPQGGSGAGALAATLPENTAATIAFSMPDGWLQQAMDRMAEAQGGETTGADLMQEFSRETGLDLPEDFETLTGDAMAITLDGDLDIDRLANASDPSDLPVGLRIQGDAEAIAAVLAKLGPQLGADSSMLDSDAEGDLVAVGPNADYRARLLEKGSLGESEVYRATVPNADKAMAVVFVDFDAGWLDTLADTDANTAANVEPLSGLGLSAWAEDDAAHVVLKLTTD